MLWERRPTRHARDSIPGPLLAQIGQVALFDWEAPPRSEEYPPDMGKRKREVEVRRMDDGDYERFAMRKGTSRTAQTVQLGRARAREFRDQPAKYVPKGRGHVEFR